MNSSIVYKVKYFFVAKKSLACNLYDSPPNFWIDFQGIIFKNENSERKKNPEHFPTFFAFDIFSGCLHIHRYSIQLEYKWIDDEKTVIQ